LFFDVQFQELGAKRLDLILDGVAESKGLKRNATVGEILHIKKRHIWQMLHVNV